MANFFYNISVLHPRHKLAYFQRTGWAPVWIAAAKDIVRNKFDRSYRFCNEVSLLTCLESMGDAVLTNNIFDSLPTFHTANESNVDKLTHYLSTGPEDIKNEDVLKWWFECRHVYPNLSRMALDYHTVPCKWFH
jgi:hypothetical protein